PWSTPGRRGDAWGMSISARCVAAAAEDRVGGNHSGHQRQKHPAREPCHRNHFSVSMVMKQVRIAALKARLSHYLRAVRRGETIAVLDRDTSVAQIVPIRDRPALRIRKPARGYPRSKSCPLAEVSQAEGRHRRAPPRGTPRSSVTRYVDASWLRRLAFRQPESRAQWSKIDRGVSSALVRRRASAHSTGSSCE